MKKITIENLRSVTMLEFEIPDPGVYLLSGENGVGKSSLLACLLRLGDRNAFPKYFRTSPRSKMVDQFDDARITYSVGGDSVCYHYSGARWVPSPKTNSSLIERFGFGSVLHIGADAKRIEPRPEDLSYRRVKRASSDIIEAANSIFGTTKFSELRVLNARRGIGSQAFLLESAAVSGGARRFFSERNFSLGEICVLKLLRELSECDNGSLLLIDELELALHPRAQVGLVAYLEKIAREKGLTVIFSTHSPTLIRSVARAKVLFLSKEGNGVRCVRGCYPAFALGQIALPDDIPPDIVLYVEDDMARNVVSSMVSQILSSEFRDAARPTVVTVPIGGFRNVVQFLNRATTLLPPNTKQFALLDRDVETESVAKLKADENHEILAEFQRVRTGLRYLPWTPEVGMCQFLARSGVESEFRAFMQDQRLVLPRKSLGDLGGLSGAEQRRAAKRLIGEIIQDVARMRVWEVGRAAEQVAQFFSNGVQKGSDASAVKELLLPILRS